MSKWAHNDVLDGPADVIIANCNAMRICTSDVLTAGEADYSKITGASALTGNVAMSGVDFTKADGDVSGRKVTVGQKSSIVITAAGDTAHIALLDTVNSKVLYVTSCAPRTVAISDETTTEPWDIEFRDPTP